MRSFCWAFGVFALCLISFITGRETTPAAHVKLSSYSTLSGAELRNTRIETQDDVHDVVIINNEFLFDVPWWRQISASRR